jgi:hypothetical protein
MLTKRIKYVTRIKNDAGIFIFFQMIMLLHRNINFRVKIMKYYHNVYSIIMLISNFYANKKDKIYYSHKKCHIYLFSNVYVIALKFKFYFI